MADRSMITRRGLNNFALALLVFLSVGCVGQDRTELTYIDTLILNNSGEVMKREVGLMRDSLKEGLWVSFRPSGEIWGIEFYEDGKWNGPWFLFYENGQISASRGTKNDGFHGKGYNYYENGVLESTSGYVNDKPDGIFEYYDEDGELWYAVEYEDGEFVKNVYGESPVIVEHEDE